MLKLTSRPLDAKEFNVNYWKLLKAYGEEFDLNNAIWKKKEKINGNKIFPFIQLY